MQMLLNLHLHKEINAKTNALADLGIHQNDFKFEAGSLSDKYFKLFKRSYLYSLATI